MLRRCRGYNPPESPTAIHPPLHKWGNAAATTTGGIESVGAGLRTIRLKVSARPMAEP